jgi:hypothetical protein
MIGVFITFRYGDNFNEEGVRKIAETARKLICPQGYLDFGTPYA